ncbi:tyrosine-type recombinase/integrase [Corallibacter sp.]|uniref:site-specific integrase n=1 Tax=Corallibacter sp. TaxID=2038084 RepID=UPI003AB5B97C
MATINYLVKGTKGYSNILLRFKNGRKFDYTASTDLKVLPSHWSKAKQRVKNSNDATYKDEVNQQLFDLENYIIKEFNSDNSKGIYIDRDWLKTKIANHFNRPVNDDAIDQVFFLPFIERFIELAPSRIIKGKNKPVSSGTITKYTTTKNKIIEYEKKFKTKLKFTDLNLTFYDRFVNFLSKDQKINLGTVGNYIGTIKTMARDAKLQGLPVHEHINHPKFFAPKVKADSIYLRDEQINKIYNHDYKGVERLENARDLFIIGLRTGLRVSDFLRLKETNIKEGFIEIETKKTGQNVVIPMHPQVKAILEKHNGFPRSISDQKFNLHIKDVCEAAGFTQQIEGSMINPKTKRKEKGTYPMHKLVTSHICRRSFASNLYGKIPNMVIMAITGHQTEAQFLKYIKITPKENAKTLQDYWLKQNKKNKLEQVKMKKV